MYEWSPLIWSVSDGLSTQKTPMMYSTFSVLKRMNDIESKQLLAICIRRCSGLSVYVSVSVCVRIDVLVKWNPLKWSSFFCVYSVVGSYRLYLAIISKRISSFNGWWFDQKPRTSSVFSLVDFFCSFYLIQINILLQMLCV